MVELLFVSIKWFVGDECPDDWGWPLNKQLFTWCWEWSAAINSRSFSRIAPKENWVFGLVGIWY